MPPLLAHRRIAGASADPHRWVLFLPGFLGAGRNWASIGRGLVRARPDWGAVLVDLRLHGDSQDFEPPHTIASSAADVRRLMRWLDGSQTVVLGHSFGGKIALATAADHDSSHVMLQQVWIVDSTPEVGRTAAGADRLLDVISRLPGPFPDRRGAAARLRRSGFEPLISDWAVTNLRRGSDGYRWNLNLPGLRQLLIDFYETDMWPVVETRGIEPELIFVRAARDSILSDTAANRIRDLGEGGSRVRLIELPGGHWLHMENPDGVLETLRRHLPD